jgi:hypothetical protein
LRYEKSLVLTPQAGAFVHGGQVLVDGTVWGSFSRLLVEFPLERYELYAHIPHKFPNGIGSVMTKATMKGFTWSKHFEVILS